MQYADIIILALIAVFVLLRLRNTLGKDIGHRPDMTKLRKQLSGEPEERVIPLPGLEKRLPPVDARDEDELTLDQLDNPEAAKQLLELKDLDPGFSVAGFLEGAKGAFEWVLNAYNENDRDTLKNLLAKDVFKEITDDLDARAAREEKLTTTLVAMKNAKITQAEIVKKNFARITVEFTTEQIHLTRDKNDVIIAGSPSQVQEVIDDWVFERDIRSRNPNWTIVET